MPHYRSCSEITKYKEKQEDKFWKQQFGVMVVLSKGDQRRVLKLSYPSIMIYGLAPKHYEQRVKTSGGVKSVTFELGESEFFEAFEQFLDDYIQHECYCELKLMTRISVEKLETAFRFVQQTIYHFDATFGKYCSGTYDPKILRLHAGPFLKEYLRVQYSWYFEGSRELKYIDIDYSERSGPFHRDTYDISELVGTKIGVIDKWGSTSGTPFYSYKVVLDEEEDHYKLIAVDRVKVDGVEVGDGKHVKISKTTKKIKLEKREITTYK